MRTRLILQATLWLWLGSLFGLLGVQRFLLDPLATGLANGTVFVVQIAPIVLVVAALTRNVGRGAFWATMASMIYFCHGVAQAAVPDGRMIGGIEIAVALGVFVSGILLMRAARDVAKPES
jgi:uncharacterized membrane protein